MQLLSVWVPDKKWTVYLNIIYHDVLLYSIGMKCSDKSAGKIYCIIDVFAMISD